MLSTGAYSITGKPALDVVASLALPSVEHIVDSAAIHKLCAAVR